MTNKEILQEEMEDLIDDIKLVYESSGKKTSGKFLEKLQLIESGNGFEIIGSDYLAGRLAGQMPPIQEIAEWIKLKGIAPLEEEMTITSLAWAIAKSIAKKGTDNSREIDIYAEVITPSRIQSIIDRLTHFNTNLFINTIDAQLRAIITN